MLPKTHMRFKDQVAIVTGGSEGIGYGISEKLALEGAKVYLVARTMEKLEKARQKILDKGGRAEVYSASITDFLDMTRIIDEVYDKEKRLDIFVNNAGTYKPVSFGDEDSIDNFKHLAELDFLAPSMISMYLVRKFMKTREELKILTISSQAAIKLFENGVGYGTAKKALSSFLFEMENQLNIEGIENIKLYRLYPGTVATEAMLPLIKKGILQNPTTLESVVDAAVDLLLNITKTRDLEIKYVPDGPVKGINRRYLKFNPEDFSLLPLASVEVVDADFDPSHLLD